jgi:catechol 2,3-dioxygenase-like lactoylglutathione lyase family enzyme
MKRFHVHVSVEDLDESVRFYSTLFAAGPSVRQSDYAKWMLEDPRINFAISTRRQPVGVNHLGFQVDSGEELPHARQHPCLRRRHAGLQPRRFRRSRPEPGIHGKARMLRTGGEDRIHG